MLQQTAELIHTQWSRLRSDPDYTIDQFIYHFTRLIESLERSFARPQIIQALSPLWQHFKASPFIGRAQHWPRGYAGDFETIHYILKGKNGADVQSVAHILEAFLLSSPICEQHRNKIRKQASLIRDVLLENPRARILSIGCGTSEDLVLNIDTLMNSAAHITLMDIDEAALRHSAERLATMQDRLALIRGNIYRSAARIAGRFDLIMAGGVFDYLDDRMVTAVLSALQPKIEEDGILFFTNIRTGNPFRICMEYMANWHLIHRSDADIVRLIQGAGLHGFRCELAVDDTGLAHLVTLHG